MSTVIELTDDVRAPHVAPSMTAYGAGAVALGLISLGVTVWGATERSSTRAVVIAGVIACWAAAAIVVAIRDRGQPLGLVMGTVSVLGAVSLAVDSIPGVAVAIAALLHLGLAVPSGRLTTRPRRGLAAAGYGAGIALAIVVQSQDTNASRWPLAAFAVVGAGVAVVAFAMRCRDATARNRARLQWMGWGVVVAVALALTVAGLHALLRWPPAPFTVAIAMTAVVPLAFVASTIEPLLARVDRLLVHTIIVTGVVALVGVVYFLVVVGLGRVPAEDERSLLGLSILAAAVAAVLAFPARHRLEEYANQRVYGERRAPDEALKTFAGRMSRAVPMDELLLQLVESLKKTMNLTAAEMWAGSDGLLDRSASVPDRGAGRLVLEGEERAVVARAHVSGNAWVQVWIPSLLAGRDHSLVKVASIAHLGELLGLIVVERPKTASPFTEDEDRVLAELARQVGLALHNVRLDSALQASLDELRQRNEELQASRARIVVTADESRRQIERNLHDGAQQHLVAMAVKLGLARQLMDADPDSAGTLMEELRSDVQATLTELRELAHGIYPPLLRDRGIAEALRPAANRALLTTTVETVGVARYAPEVEAAVYFCCLEAMQNAGKHAGEDARVTVRVVEEEGALEFSVIDDGSGFDVAKGSGGHGFENMRDRLGAIGGELTVTAAPGDGSRIEGRIPLTEATRRDEP